LNRRPGLDVDDGLEDHVVELAVLRRALEDRAIERVDRDAGLDRVRPVPIGSARPGVGGGGPVGEAPD
jgi:hypothetical protein